MTINSLNSFKHLKSVVSIETVLADKGLITHFRKKGDKLTGPCPVHKGDNENAFVVNLSKNVWYCFTRCGKGGDIVDLVRFMDSKTYRRTAEYLVSLTESSIVRPPLRIPTSNKYQPYTRRLALNPSVPLLQNKGIWPETARYFETGSYYGSGFLSGSIGVRLHDLQGRPVGYAARRLDPALSKKYGKWKFPKGLPKNKILYNFHRVRIKKSLVVTECPWGVMRLAQLQIPAVSLLGLHASHTQLNLLRKTQKIIILFDGDQAGINAGIHLKNILHELTSVDLIIPPHGLDPDDFDDKTLFDLLNKK